MFPSISSLYIEFGLALFIPTVPLFVTTNDVPVLEPIANAGAVPLAAVGLILSYAQGVEDP